MKLKIGFIGLGLIGGSIAKAIRQYYPEYEIVAFDKNKETLALATQESSICLLYTSRSEFQTWLQIQSHGRHEQERT